MYYRALLFPKGEFLLTTLPRGPIDRVALIISTYWFQSFTIPTTHEKKPFIVRVVRWLGGGYLAFLSLILKNDQYFFSFFLNVFSY